MIGSEKVEGRRECAGRPRRLASEAQEVLEKWKEKPILPGDLGRFLLEVEQGEDCSGSLEEHQGTWRAHVESWKTLPPSPGDSEAATDALINKLHEDYFIHYARDFANLSDFLTRKEGNCVAQTKLILAAMAASGITLPPHQVLGIQVFDDHLQPVIYDRESRELWILTTGLRTKRIEGPVYHAAMFYHAFLKAQGESSPVTEDELLIREATHPKRRLPAVPELVSGAMERVFRNQGFAFPQTGLFYADGPIPERTTMSRPVKHHDTTAASGPSLPTGNAGTDDEESKKILAWEDVVSSEWRKTFQKQIKWSPWIADDDYLVFQSYQDKNRYLRTDSEKRGEFLKSLFFENLKRLEEKEAFRKALALSADPHRILREIEAKEIEELLSLYQAARDNQRHLKYKFQWPSEDSEKRFEAECAIKLPLWAQLEKNLDAWQRWAEAHPKEMWLFFNQLPETKKLLAYQLVSWVAEDSRNELWRFFVRHLRMTDDSGRESPYHPALDPQFGVPMDPEEWIEIEAATDLNGFRDKPPFTRQQASPATMPEEITVSYETGLILAFGGYRGLWLEPPPPIHSYWREPSRRPSLWDRKVSEILREITAKGMLEDFYIINSLYLWTRHECDDLTCLKSRVPSHIHPLLEDMGRRHPEFYQSISPPKQGGPMDE